MAARSGRSGPWWGARLDQGLVGVASPLFERALPAVLGFEYPRAWAFALLGIDEYLKRLGGDRGVQQVRKELASVWWRGSRRRARPTGSGSRMN